MNRILKAVATLSIALPLAGMAQPQATSQPAQLSRQELRTLAQNAQYQKLADYYHQQETQFRAKAASEKMEWDRRAQMSQGGPELKIPNPADSARRLYESYSYDADHSADLANHYQQLAAAAQSKS
jgi:hypothetical protein